MISWLLGLVASLIIVAVGVTLKAVNDAFLLKKANKEIDRLWSEIEALKQEKDEAITRIKESAVAREGELSHRIMELEEALKHKESCRDQRRYLARTHLT